MRFRPALVCLSPALAVGLLGTARSDVYVGHIDPPAVLVFATDALGDTAPVRVIAGPHTGITSVDGLTVDDEHRELYVSNFSPGAILVFPLDASGDVAPLRTLINGPASQLGIPRRVAIDSLHDELVVPRLAIGSPDPFSGDGLQVYPRTASGDVAPLRRVTGTTTRFQNVFDIALRTASDEIITNSGSGGGPFVPGVLAFPRTASGDVAPSRILTGPATHFDNFTNHLAYDPAADEIYADTGINRGYAVFPGTANGDVPPTRMVVGPDSALHRLRGIAFDAAHQRVIVIDSANQGGAPVDLATLRVFERTDDGDVPAVMTVGGPSTSLVSPVSIAVDKAGGFTGAGPRVFATRPGFSARVTDPGALGSESFDGGLVTKGVEFCGETLDAGSSDGCFLPGQVLGGFSVRSRSGTGVAVFGGGALGNASPAVGAISSGDATVVEFASPVGVLAIDVYVQPTPKNDGATISIYDAANRLLAVSRTQGPAAGQSVFVGVVSPIPIARVEVAPAGGIGQAAIDNLQATGLAPVQTGSDAGAGAGSDAGAGAGGGMEDAGTSGGDHRPGGGCGCRSSGAGSGVGAWLVAGIVVGVIRRRRRA
jgi:MYXO-CTERM domain-containing protein